MLTINQPYNLHKWTHYGLTIIIHLCDPHFKEMRLTETQLLAKGINQVGLWLEMHTQFCLALEPGILFSIKYSISYQFWYFGLLHTIRYSTLFTEGCFFFDLMAKQILQQPWRFCLKCWQSSTEGFLYHTRKVGCEHRTGREKSQVLHST